MFSSRIGTENSQLFPSFSKSWGAGGLHGDHMNSARAALNSLSLESPPSDFPQGGANPYQRANEMAKLATSITFAVMEREGALPFGKLVLSNPCLQVV